MKQRWTLQGRSPRGLNEWLDLMSERRRRNLPDPREVNDRARRIDMNAEYRMVLKDA